MFEFDLNEAFLFRSSNQPTKTKDTLFQRLFPELLRRGVAGGEREKDFLAKALGQTKVTVKLRNI